MFSIGLFTTYLPYLLAAMLYGAYLGIHTIMKAESGALDDSDKTACREIRHTPDAAQDLSGPGNFHYDKYQAEAPGVPQPVVTHACLVTVPCEPPPDLVHTWFFSSLFGRPPPVAA